MARHRIPKNVGPYYVIIAMAGNYAVWNRRTGKQKVYIVCHSKEQAEQICEKLNNGNHEDEIWT